MSSANSPMACVTLGARSVALEPQETVLDGLLRCGVPIPYSCKAGVCQSCLIRLTHHPDEPGGDGSALAQAQQGLSETLQAQGYFLACRMSTSNVAGPLEVALPGEDAFFPATISRLHLLTASVLQVRLKVPADFQFRAGQYVTLIRPDGLSRSYSIANRPTADHSIELHVRRVRGGLMSGWLFDQAMVGDPLQVRGPAGNCFYVAAKENNPQPLLLAGSGTGLAPLYGILQDALVAGHRAPIRLFHAARSQDGLYLREELAGLSDVFPHFAYQPCLLAGIDAASQGALLAEIVERAVPNLTGWKVYLCGDPATVETLREMAFLNGAASSAIFADPFLPSQR